MGSPRILGVAPRAPPPRPAGRPAAPPATPQEVAASAAGRARWILASLAASLLGIVGLAAILYGVKFHGVGASLAGLPTRDLYVASFALIFAPLFVTLFERVPAGFLVIPIAIGMLVYPLFNPFGIPYSRDPIFNFQFAQSLLQGHWVPGSGVTLQAVAYSYYPASGVYNAEFAVFTGLPLSSAFLVAVPILHLLVLPAAIYALGARMFGSRYAFAGVLFYLGTASILFGVPVQQEFAIPFFALTLLCLALLSVGPPSPTRVGLEIAVVLFSSFVIVSHHLTSYFLGAWLAGLFLVPYALGGTRVRQVVGLGRVRGREVYLLREESGTPESPLRSGYIAARYFLVFLLYTYFVSFPVFSNHLLTLGQALTNLVVGTPPTAQVAASGQSFPLYQQAWIYLSLGVLLVVAILTARELVRDRRQRFLVTNLVIGSIATIATLAFLPTAFAFLPLREMEFSAVFFAPALAWWLAARLHPRLQAWVARHRLPGPTVVRRRAPQVAVLALAALIVTGGCLVPIDVRDQFAPRSAVLVDSPLYIDPASYQAAVWAHAHLTSSSLVWGDELAFSVFGGFGQFQMRYNQYALFNGTNLSAAQWHTLHVGDYIVTDRYMTQINTEFPGPSSSQPAGPLSLGQVEKFHDPPYLDQVYDDPTFAIYEVMQIPPGR
jgi:hypothetical protein